MFLRLPVLQALLQEFPTLKLVELQSNLLLVRGAVAGPNGGFVMVRQSVKS